MIEAEFVAMGSWSQPATVTPAKPAAQGKRWSIWPLDSRFRENDGLKLMTGS
jgi:hypothetical protein